jgi:hypothetical protein
MPMTADEAAEVLKTRNPRLLVMLAELCAAVDQEQAANSNEARAKAQAAALTAQDALDSASGINALRRRRMIAEARDLPLGAAVEAGEFGQIERDCAEVTLSGLVRMRQALARHAMDARGVLTGGLAELLAANTRQNAKGYKGPLDGPVRAGGVDPNSGAANQLKELVVNEAGYTAGVEIGEGRIPFTVWKRAERRHNEIARKGRQAGYKIENVQATTIKDWCLRDGELGRIFANARAEGVAGGVGEIQILRV